MELRIPVSELTSEPIFYCWENTKFNPPPDVLTQNPKIRELPEMADFKSFYGTPVIQKEVPETKDGGRW